MERRIFGVRKVSIQQGDHKSHSLNNELWKHQVNPGQHWFWIDKSISDSNFQAITFVQIGLSGEMNNIYTPEGSSRTQWTAINKSMHLPLIWYKVHQMYISLELLTVIVTDSFGKLLSFGADDISHTMGEWPSHAEPQQYGEGWGVDQWREHRTVLGLLQNP